VVILVYAPDISDPVPGPEFVNILNSQFGKRGFRGAGGVGLPIPDTFDGMVSMVGISLCSETKGLTLPIVDLNNSLNLFLFIMVFIINIT
jgi:hypothetical protein